MENRFTIIHLNRVDCLTLFGMCLTCIACVLCLNGQFDFALGFFYLAMLADAFDGILARKLGLTRDFGRYLDGFVDVFDYLMGPALFLYMWGFDSWYAILILIAFMVSGIVRLSVFNEMGNIDKGDRLAYLGMPVFWSLLFLGVIYIASWFTGKEPLMPVITLFFILATALMIFKRPFHKFQNPMHIFIFVSGCALLFLLKGLLGHYTPWVFPHILTALYFIFPVIIGGSLHMVAVKKDWLPFLKIPINKRLFGKNKTIRGFVLMPLFTILGALLVNGVPNKFCLTCDLTNTHFAFIGGVLGFAYVLSELPNSYIKRRLGVPPGGSPTTHAWLFFLADQLDSALGAAIALMLIFHMPVTTALIMLAIVPAIALSVKRLLYIAKLKESYA